MTGGQKWLKKQEAVEGQAPISVEEVGAFCQKRDLQAAVVLTVARDGTVAIVSYGETKKKCTAIGRWAQGLWETAISALPFTTIFGYGYGGVPTPIPDEALIGTSLTRERLNAYESYLLQGYDGSEG